MSRQHAAPVVFGDGQALTLPQLSLGSGPDQISESDLQALIHAHPLCLPIAEVDQNFSGAVPICRELATSAGYIDNLLLTPSGLPVLVECKLWRNPQARREVVGQIIDYAKELARWTSSDLQREVSKSTGRAGNVLIDILGEAGFKVDEIELNDALTANLRRGRVLLLIVGDGIREGVEAISEYLQGHAGLHFTLGLVELPIFALADGKRMMLPRVLARTTLINRSVVTVPDGYRLVEGNGEGEETLEDDDPVGRVAFWRDFVAGLILDDPEQPMPKAGRQGYITTGMPVPGGNAWLVIYRSEPTWEVGVYLSFARESIGARVNDILLEDSEDILSDLGGTAKIQPDRMGRRLISDALRTGSWAIPSERMRAFAWLRARTNDFVNVLRPKVKSIMADLKEQ